MGTQAFLVVGVLQSQPAAEDLPEHLPELLRGHVVEKRVDDRAEVEERVGEGEKDHVCLEVRLGPVMFGFCRSHDPPNLIWHPTHSQCHHDQSWAGKNRREKETGEKNSMRTKINK